MADANEKELVEKVSAYVNRFYKGDYTRAFNEFARSKRNDGLLDAEELSEVLKACDIGNRLSRGIWVSGIMKKLDKDLDNKISGAEFASVFRQG